MAGVRRRSRQVLPPATGLLALKSRPIRMQHLGSKPIISQHFRYQMGHDLLTWPKNWVLAQSCAMTYGGFSLQFAKSSSSEANKNMGVTKWPRKRSTRKSVKARRPWSRTVATYKCLDLFEPMGEQVLVTECMA